ncbi:MAG: DNA recombination and repair protein RecO [Firmicutes bacterium]|nr:DNA recombination and repair protein RecO [Bacillota bacterium]MDI6706743.1 DNA repair protein RecO [Bacillota bacterium]
MLFKTRGVVTKTVNYGEGDKIITLLTDTHGKIQAMARGARRTKSKLIAGTQLFCYGEFLLYKGKSWYYIDQVEIDNTFYKLRNDLIRLSFGTYFIELINEITQPELAPGNLFDLAVQTLETLSDETTDPELILRAAEIKALAYSGFRPQLRRCANCGRPGEMVAFSPSAGGVICRECRDSGLYGYSISSQALKIMDLMLRWDLDKLKCLKLDLELYKELEKVMRAYVAAHIEKDFVSNRFIDSIKKIK